MLHSMHPICGMLCPSAPSTLRSKSAIGLIVGLGVNVSYRSYDMLVICEPLATKYGEADIVPPMAKKYLIE